MKRKRLRVKSKKLQEALKKSKGKDSRKDFFELLRRAVNNPALV